MSSTPKQIAMRWVLLAFFVLVSTTTAFCVLGYRDHRRRQENQNMYVCSHNLKRIYNAKLMWAAKNKRPDEDTPRESDLFGPSHELTEKPVCPGGGLYTIGKVGEEPKCSIAAHNF